MAGGGGRSGQHDIVAFSQTSQLTGEPPEIVRLGMPSQPPLRPSSPRRSNASRTRQRATGSASLPTSSPDAGKSTRHALSALSGRPAGGGCARRCSILARSISHTPADLPRAELTRSGKCANTRRVELGLQIAPARGMQPRAL
jgi:hypothetical protein